jgi:hypothetical protein
MYIIARPKYNKTIKFKKHYMNPKLISNINVDQFIEKIREYEVPIGHYKDSNGTICPEDSLVIYCTTNPRSMKKSSKQLLYDLMQGFTDQNPSIFNNLYGRLNSCILSNKEKINIITIDIDDKSELKDVLSYVDSIKIKVLCIIETRGGYHVLFRQQENIDLIFKNYKDKYDIGDICCAIPGTFQGGFPVKFI